ncbi:MAG: hypothetical protein IPK26_23995 [Planctomycetes bacterium]|nr:hypothetical protein [Planctomycetota bacterium]
MSGDTARNDDQELSDDFILEDAPAVEPEPTPLTPPTPAAAVSPPDVPPGDLAQLFDDEVGATASAGSSAATPPAAGADDLLFVDHTEGLKPTLEFEGRRQFAEASGMQWKGNRMTPDEIGIPIENGAETDASAAEASFTSQIDSLLAEDEFGVDGDQELQLVDNDADLDAAGAPGRGETFILDEGNGQWSEPGQAAPAAAADATPDDTVEFAPESAEFSTTPAAEAVEFTGEIDEASVAQVESFGVGSETEPEARADEDPAAAETVEGDDAWEPLPNAAEQFEAEVAGPVAQEGAPGESDADRANGAEPVLVGAGVAAGEAVDAAIYVDDQAMRVVGGQVARRRPWLRAFTSLAAAVLVLSSGAAVVLRPEWFGLRFQPDLVERVDIARPDVDVKVPPPAMPRPATNSGSPGVPVGTDPNGNVGPTEPTVVGPLPSDPKPTDPPTNTTPANTGDPTPVPPGPEELPADPNAANPTQGETANPQPGPTTPVPPPEPPAGTGENPAVSTGTGETSLPPETTPVVSVPAPVTPPVPQQGEPAPPGDGPPSTPNVAVTSPVNGPESIPAPKREPLLSAGPDLLIGEPVAVEGPAAHAPPGVVPGGKAFAQLHNGNFFVGAIKAVGKDAITMRLDGGEVTLAMADVSRVAPLDSTEFQALQESTSGFLRLSNRNRLVGTILKDMADDHYVLQMKSNRLMVPKDQIESVQGGATGGVTVGATKDDEAWLRELAARMLHESTGSGRKPD